MTTSTNINYKDRVFRGFCYFAKMYEKYKEQNRLNMFSSRRQMIPTPQYYVFYNGTAEAPDKTYLKLSEAFMQPVKEFLAEQMPLDEAIDAAVVWCIKNDYMVEYLRKHRAEVTDMWLTEFNEEEYKEAMKEEGRAEACITHIENLMKNADMTLEDACTALSISIEEYNSAKSQIELN